MVITRSEHNNVHDGYLNKDFLGTNTGKQPNKVCLCMEKKSRSGEQKLLCSNHNKEP